ncbi:hypothetical protein ADK86_11670 [Streptomyces sp. NRRL F-5755]|uniref:hypothetical protein n=1 Tax=Streptomyces sp. NRRL F-5755 TaxID=1519475 RepID=UPI0006AEF4FD|nr:hypothetical protein [Streptomyces sp. NRRL F-5755]KOU01836.1 hypothetical protein ADK86_11670 [Streptomyces sp. NRRL F-5755]
MKRSPVRFVDFGRWTIGTWSTGPDTWFAIGYTYSSSTRPYGVVGPAITFGRRSWGAYARYSRAEYRARKNEPWAKESEEFRPLPRRRSWWCWWS